MPPVEWEQWSPGWCSNIEGRYTRRTYDEDGIPEEQRIECQCTVCGATFRRVCSSGLVRDRINEFAKHHTHKDALEAPRIVRPGSLRRGTP